MSTVTGCFNWLVHIDDVVASGDATKIIARAHEAVDGHDLKGARRLLLAALGLGLGDDQRCSVLIELGWVDGAEGDYPQAEEHLSEAAAIAERRGNAASVCECLRELGLVQRYQGKLLAADETLRRAVVAGERCGHHLGIGQGQFNRATVATMRGDFLASRELLARATEAADRYRGHERATTGQVELLYANIAREKAVLARIARDFDAARTLLNEASGRYSSIGRRVGFANAQRELGAVLQQIGDLDGARRHFGFAFGAYLRSGRPTGAAMVARRLGHLDLTAESADPVLLARAERRLLQAVRLGGGEPTNLGASVLRLAVVARLRGRFDEAEELLARAAAVYETMQRPTVDRDMSEIFKERGMIARTRGDHATALTFFEHALATIRVDEDVQAASVDHYLIARELVLLDRAGDALAHALASFTLDDDSGRRLRDPADRRSFYVSTSDTYELAMTCAARAGDGRAALAVAVAAQSEALAAFVRAGTGLAPDVRDLVQRIALATATNRAEPELQELFAQLERHTSIQLREAVADKPVDTDEIVASLPPDGHALLLDAFDSENPVCSRIWLAPGEDPVVDLVRLSGPARRFIDEYTRGSAEIGWIEQQDLLDEFGAAVVPPGLAHALRASLRPVPLAVSTGNLLGAVPVAALRIDGSFLAELAQLALVPSLTLLASLRSRAPRPGRGVLAYLDTAIGGSRELRAIRHSFTLVDEVSGAGLRTALQHAEHFSAVVVTSHGSRPADQSGSFVDSGARGGLAQALELTGCEDLTAAELMTMSLPDAFITPSCWSGRVLSQAALEPLGLPVAALLAGARWVLAGTVNLKGFPAATVMSHFYRHLAAGWTPSAALQGAQTEYLASRPSVPPAAWAGLTIIGDGFTSLRT